MTEKLYTLRQAITLGQREVCRTEGHEFQLPDLTYTQGGIQGVNAACDEITCRRCDVKFTATYPTVA